MEKLGRGVLHTAVGAVAETEVLKVATNETNHDSTNSADRHAIATKADTHALIRSRRGDETRRRDPASLQRGQRSGLPVQTVPVQRPAAVRLKPLRVALAPPRVNPDVPCVAASMAAAVSGEERG